MDDLLFLTQRIPYPPNKGDKIRSWHILRHLCRRFRVHLGCLVDEPDDWRHVETLRGMVAELCCVPLVPSRARFRSLRGLPRRRPLTEGYFSDDRLRRWVAEIAERIRPHWVYVCSSAMAPYVEGLTQAVRVLDLVDVDSEKWRQQARTRGVLWQPILKREAATLLRLERQAAASFDATLLASATEAALFRSLAPESADRIHHVGNGVDLDFFRPDAGLPDPYRDGRPAIVFTGTMDYWPNVDATCWFANSVMPLLRVLLPPPVLWIVGRDPTSRISRLGTLRDVCVTGEVPDIRPYLMHADAVVVPLRIARGVQNKALEAMAMARPVIATPQVAAGLGTAAREGVRVAADAAAFAREIQSVLAEGGKAFGLRARAQVEANYSWATALARLDEVLDSVRPALPPSIISNSSR